MMSQLASIPLFAPLDEQQRLILAQQQQWKLEAGQTLDQDQTGPGLCVLLQGSLRVLIDRQSNVPLALIHPGEWVGEETVFADSPTPLKVVADEPSTLLCISRQVVHDLIQASPAWSRVMLENITRRLHNRNETLHRYEQTSTSDLLTGLRNRRWLNSQLPRLLYRCQYSHHPLTLILTDIDNLQQINADYGQDAGNLALQAIANAMRYQLRADAVLARYGSDELLVVLPELAADIGHLVAERLRRAVEELTVTLADGRILPRLTVSVGMVEARSREEVEELLGRGHAALAQAIDRGRNRIAFVPCPGESADQSSAGR